jgi:hypothetical protein
MPVTNFYKALKGAQTHVERSAPGLAGLIRKGFDSLERTAETHKDGISYRLGTCLFPILGEVAELYLDVVGCPELMVDAYSGTMIGVDEFNELRRKGIAVAPHVVKGKKPPPR